MDSEQLRRALVEAGFTEAAAMVEVIDVTSLLRRPASGKTSTTDFDEAA